MMPKLKIYNIMGVPCIMYKRYKNSRGITHPLSNGVVYKKYYLKYNDDTWKLFVKK